MSKKKVVVFGLGKIYQTFLNLYDSSKAEIIALSDNNKKAREEILSTNVVEPDKISNLEFDYVIITTRFYQEIGKQLIEYGIQKECILNFNDIYEKLVIRDNYALMNLLKDNIHVAVKYSFPFEKIAEAEERNLFLSAKIFANEMKDKRLTSLEDAEFQVYSQFGEDGIIQWLIRNVVIDQKTFIEFGVEDYSEANTRFLLMNNNWSGLVMDGSHENMNRLRQWKYFWKYDLSAVAAFITKENINQLISDAGYHGDIGILSIDLDGNDYWILNAINCVSPRILICEYNNIYGIEHAVSIPYDEKFFRTEAHYSNLYWGASLSAFRDWAEKNDYYFMGSNSAGNNAFFVRKDCISSDKIPRNANVFVESKYRESRNKNGELTYKRGRERLKCIEEMQLVDLRTGRLDSIKNIYHI